MLNIMITDCKIDDILADAYLSHKQKRCSKTLLTFFI